MTIKKNTSDKCSGFYRLCIEDQARVIIGAVIVLLIVLGYYVDTAFFWITGLAGAILLISGLFGSCMLRICLSKLECNEDCKDHSICNGSMPALKPAKMVASSSPAKKKATKKKATKKKRK